MSGRYQPGGGGAVTNVNLVFNKGSINITASPSVNGTGSGLDMEKVANELVDALAKEKRIAKLGSP
jgi:hypothetical protein